MDADFIAYYKENIDFLREKSEIFAQQYPTIAKNLGLSSFECADPFVERVLEGVAFLAARNEQKLDQGSTFLLQDLLSTLAPALALPHPALGNFQLTDINSDKTLSFEQGTQFKTQVKKTDCKFSTLFKVDITPAMFSEPQQHFQPLNPQFPGKSSLSLQLDINAVQALPDDIEIYLNLPDLEAGLIAQWLTLNLCDVYFKPPVDTTVAPLAAPSASSVTLAPTSVPISAPLSASASFSAQAQPHPPAQVQAQFQIQAQAQPQAHHQAQVPSQAQSATVGTKAWGTALSMAQAPLQPTTLNQASTFNQSVIGALGALHALGTVGAGTARTGSLEANIAMTGLGAGTLGAGQVSATSRSSTPELIRLQVNQVNAQQSRLEQELTAAGLSPQTIAQAFFNGSNGLTGTGPQAARGTNQGNTVNWDNRHTYQAYPAYSGAVQRTIDDWRQGFATSRSLNQEAIPASIGAAKSQALNALASNNLNSKASNASGISAELSILVKPNLLGDLLGTGNGINYLTLYTAYPQLCKYVLLRGLGKALRQIPNVRSGRIIFVFNAPQPKLNLGAMPFLTNVLPLINLFPKRCSYTQLSMREHYHLIPERTQPDDFEVVTISSLEILGSDHLVAHTALPFFSQSLEPDQLFFIQERHERTKGTFIPRSSYLKSECFITLCGANFKPLLEPHLSLVANTYCSNADLPLFIKQGHKLKTLDDAGQATLLDLKLNVEPALIIRSNQQSYALLSYFNLHLHNLISQTAGQIQLRLQELIKAYATPHDNPELELLAQALYSVDKTPKTFRHLQHGIVFFEPGLQLKLFFDPEKSGGSSLFFFARILCAMLQSFVPLNEHCEVLAYTKQGVLLTHSTTFQEGLN